MLPHPSSGSASANSSSSARGGALAESDAAAMQSDSTTGFASDFAELAAKFSAHGVGNLSIELSVELALEIVLNEIVEGACLAMGATGAAIVLLRDGVMSCRASSGATAPPLGTRLNPGTGISGECVQMRQLQRCDDAQADPRVDVEACRKLDVRSVLAMPLLGDGDLLGVFEVFSSRPEAFGERDERTLDALAQRVVTNLRRAAEPIAKPAVEATVPEVQLHDSPASCRTPTPSAEAPVYDEDEGSSLRSSDLVTWALGLSVLACAVLLGALSVRHFVSQTKSRTYLPAAAPEPAASAQGGTARTSNAAPDPTPMPVSVPPAPGVSGEKRANAARLDGLHRTGGTDLNPGEGELRVYENGKEVFRLPSSPSHGSLPANEQGSEKTSAAAVPDRILELAPTPAEDSLVHRLEPDYPEVARQQQIQGVVVLDVRIAQDGSVQEVGPVSGNPLLVQAATDAVKQWRFLPRQAAGRGREMQTRITLNFRLPQ